MKKRVIIDISPLAIGEREISDGICRVTWNTINEIYKNDTFELTFYSSIPDKLEDCKMFIKYDRTFKSVNFIEDIHPAGMMIINLCLASLRRLKYSNNIVRILSASILKIKLKLIHSELLRADIYISTFFEIPDYVRKNTYIKKFMFIYDLIPLKFPNLFNLSSNSDYSLYRVFKNIPIDVNLIAISESTKSDFLKFRPDYPTDKISVIYLAAVETFKQFLSIRQIEQMKKSIYLPKGSSYIISNSTLEIRKNIDYIINSFSFFLDKYKYENIYLVLTGKVGWKVKNILKSFHKSRENRLKIIFTGYLPDRDLAILYSGALCFTYMSIYEGFGLPPLEAMKCGCPVIVSNNSSLPEVVGDAGILLDNNDIGNLSSSFNDLYLNLKHRKFYSKKSIERSKLFSWKKFSEELINLILLEVQN